MKSYQDFMNKLFTSNKIMSFICSINLVKPSLFLKFNIFIHNLTTFYFHLFHPTPMYLSMFFLVLRFIVVLFSSIQEVHSSCFQLTTIQHNHNFINSRGSFFMLSAHNNPTQPQFHQFNSTKYAAPIRQFDPGNWFLLYSTK